MQVPEPCVIRYFLVLSGHNQANYLKMLNKRSSPPSFAVGLPFLLGWHGCSEIFAIVSKASSHGEEEPDNWAVVKGLQKTESCNRGQWCVLSRAKSKILI